MIQLIDYGAGNLFSVANALRVIGVEHQLVRSATDLSSNRPIILPGVGHIRTMMAQLRRNGLDQSILDQVQQGTPLLGICLGMQALFLKSEEDAGTECLGLLEGTVHGLPKNVRSPNMGWCPVQMLEGQEEWFYFAHSFYIPRGVVSTAFSDIGVEISAVVQEQNVTGVQFHPEKSGKAGLKWLEGWVKNAR